MFTLHEMHEKIARALGWTVQEARGFSLPSLRDIVRPVNAEIAAELDRLLARGSHVRDPNGR